MNKTIRAAMILATIWISGCSVLHDDKGWEHKGDSKTHQNTQSTIFEHQH